MSDLFSELGCGRVASIIGRYYAMDRDNRWDRVEHAWRMLTRAEAPHHAESAIEALNNAYARDEADEFVAPTLVRPAGEPEVRIESGDAVLFMNFRADRARQITRAFVQPGFDQFECGTRPDLAAFVTTTEYASDIPAHCAFPPETLHNVLPEYLDIHGRTQLRIAETEKYAHVTFFFSGGPHPRSQTGSSRPSAPVSSISSSVTLPTATWSGIPAISTQLCRRWRLWTPVSAEWRRRYGKPGAKP
jgi:2,3-bisphosphoglycerate-independent phosphoglycerate mutase